MFHFRSIILFLLFLTSQFLTAPAHAVIELQFWHAMRGSLEESLNSLVQIFNGNQSDFRIKLTRKNSYSELLNAGLEVARTSSAPHILQVFEIGTATMMAAKGATKSVDDLMRETGENLNTKAYIPAISAYYTDRSGKMVSLPFNTSTAVLFYNKDSFAKAGLNPEKPPQTWEDLADAAIRIRASSASRCAYTSSWPTWVHLETFAAWHNTPLATRNNGFDGWDARLNVNTALILHHLQNLIGWSRQGLFSYTGRTNEADARFYSGECAMLTGSSAVRGLIAQNAQFQWGESPLPYYSKVEGAPQNTIVGGASLWVMSGKSKEEERGVAKFFAFLAQPNIQAQWHQSTGYLPLTTAAYELTKRSGYYAQNPGADIPITQMLSKTTSQSKGLRLGNMALVRDIVSEELESMLANNRDPRIAIPSMLARSNEVLARFESTLKNHP